MGDEVLRALAHPRQVADAQLVRLRERPASVSRVGSAERLGPVGERARRGLGSR